MNKTLKNRIYVLAMLFVFSISATIIKYEEGYVKVGTVSFCAACELNNTCLVTCRLDDNGGTTPICANYGQQACACPGPAIK